MLPGGDLKPVVSLSKEVIANYYGFAATWDGNWLVYLDRDSSANWGCSVLPDSAPRRASAIFQR